MQKMNASYSRVLRTGGAISVVAAMLMAVPAYAQSEDEAAADNVDIVVTAQRREEKAKDVPITLTTITAESLGNNPVAPTQAFVYRGLCGKLWR